MTQSNPSRPFASRGMILGVRKNVFFLGLVSLFNDFSHEMIYSVLPAFFLQVLGAGPVALGVFEGIAEAFSNILKAFSGRLSDFLKKRKTIAVFGYAISISTRPLFVLIDRAWQVLVLRVIDRIGKGVRDAPRDALIADSSDAATIGRSFGLHRAMDTTGAMLGPLAAFLILGVFSKSFSFLFLVSFIVGTLAILSFVLVKDARAENRTILPKKPKFSFSFSDLPRRFMFIVLAIFLLSLGNFPVALTLLRGAEAGLSLLELPLVYFIFNAAFVAASLPAGRLSDRIGAKKVIILGYMLCILAYLGFIYASSVFATLTLFGLLGIFSAFTDGIQRALTGRVVLNPELHGTAMGLMNMTIGLGMLGAGVVGGWLWSSFGYQAAFWYGAVAIVFGLVVFGLAFKEE